MRRLLDNLERFKREHTPWEGEFCRLETYGKVERWAYFEPGTGELISDVYSVYLTCDDWMVAVMTIRWGNQYAKFTEMSEIPQSIIGQMGMGALREADL